VWYILAIIGTLVSAVLVMNTLPRLFISFLLLTGFETLAANTLVAQSETTTYVSKDGGFEFASVAKVKESTSGTIRTVQDRVDVSPNETYTIEAAFYPVSMGNREDVDSAFSKIYPSTKGCVRNSVKPREIQGLPARIVHEKCGNISNVGMFVFAGNRIFIFTGFISPNTRSEELERIADSFKVNDPRFIGRGEWTKFSFREAGFSADFAGFPYYRTIRSSDGTGYALENYSFIVRETPRTGTGDSTATLDKFQELYADQLNAVVISQADVNYHGLPGRRFEIAFVEDSKGFHEFCFFILGIRHAYTLNVRSKVDAPTPKSDVERFFDSFHLD